MITLAEIIPYIPRALIAEALDDTGSGTGEINADLLEAISTAAASRAANCFGGTVPDAQEGEAHDAEIVFVCETLLDRRGYSDRQNPFAAKARDWEKRLRALASGTEGAGPGGGSVVSQDCTATPAEGYNLV